MMTKIPMGNKPNIETFQTSCPVQMKIMPLLPETFLICVQIQFKPLTGQYNLLLSHFIARKKHTYYAIGHHLIINDHRLQIKCDRLSNKVICKRTQNIRPLFRTSALFIFVRSKHILIFDFIPANFRSEVPAIFSCGFIRHWQTGHQHYNSCMTTQ